ncbi:peptidoglycan-binding protein [Sulfurovum sp.]|uniref:peptidoglycan-binding protein n=1 Tax=Sulfurovum sp. TaxID=1969726 RepID=UPI002600A8B5|nr:peptidoglycan-binding protein [Sulfurovum sp.]
MKIQLSLTKLGYYYSDIDGKLNGFETREAVKSMNIALSNGNAMFLDQRSREILVYLADLYRFNDILLSNIDDKKSANIKIQTALKILGCYHGKIDGLLGKDTKNCITEFEKNNNMDANGELDKREKYTLFRMAVEVNNRSIDDTKKELYKKVNQQAAKIQKLSGPADKSADKSITQKLKKPESDLEFSDSLE